MSNISWAIFSFFAGELAAVILAILVRKEKTRIWILVIGTVFSGILAFGLGGRINAISFPILPVSSNNHPTSIVVTLTSAPESAVSPSISIPIINSSSTEFSEVNNAQMVLVEAGKFSMGASPSMQRQMLALCQSCDPVSVTDQSPQRTIYLDGFWIDKTEVTIAQFQKFVEDENYITTAEKISSSLLFNRSTKKYTTTSGIN